MAKKCIFCGEEFGTFSGKKLTVGYDSEDVCPACFEKYCDLGETELAEKILATGRARHAQTIREYMNELRVKEQAAQEKAAAREAQKEADRKKRAVKSVGTTVAGTVGREVGKKIGKQVGGMLKAAYADETRKGKTGT